MASEKPALDKDFNPYITGFLSETFSGETAPDYGYHENHLPVTKGRTRQMQSILALIDWAEGKNN